MATDFETTDSQSAQNHNHCHRLADVQLGHLLIHSGLTSRSIFNGLPFFLMSFGLYLIIIHNLLRGILFICCNHFLLYTVFCPELGLYSVHLQFLCLFYNLYKCILLFLSHISSLLLLLILHVLLQG